MTSQSAVIGEQSICEMAELVFRDHSRQICRKTDAIFATLLSAQWLFAIVVALTITPRTWKGAAFEVHPHVWAAFGLGFLLFAFPLAAIIAARGSLASRLWVATAQMMHSALIIHLMGGRIEAHFHVFGSLAILAFYRDWRVFIPAVAVVTTDHIIRGIYWPESVFSVAAAAPWRAFEHAAWVLFEVAFLLWGIRNSVREMRTLASLHAAMTFAKRNEEHRVADRTRELADEQRLMESIVATLPHPLYWKDCDLVYRGCNPAFARIAGLASTHDVIGLTDDELRDVSTLRWDGQSGDREAIASGQAQCNVEEKITDDLGMDLGVYLTSRAPLRDGAGNVAGVAGIAIDVTAHRQLQEELAQSRKLESIGQLAAGLAHEINTPLQYVCDNLEFLAQCAEKLVEVLQEYQAQLAPDAPALSWEVRSDRMREFLQSCRVEYLCQQAPLALEESREGARRVVQIIRAMKEFTHPGSRERTLTDLNHALSTTATITRNRWKQVAQLECDFDPQLPQVAVFAGEVNQALINLVVNAADAIEEFQQRIPDREGRIVLRENVPAVVEKLGSSW